jgi:RND family efflux transporter MFP subunit
VAAQLEAGQARKELERLTGLYHLEQVSEQEIDELKRKLEGLQEALRIDEQLLVLQKQKLDRAIIRAPSPGMVLFAWPLERGALINAGQLLLSIVSAEGGNIEVQLNQDDAAKMSAGQQVLFRSVLGNQMDSLQPGRIEFVAPEIKAGLVKAIIVPNEKLLARLGSALEVNLALRSRRRALLVPLETVEISDGKTFVWAIENGVVEKRSVIAGAHNHRNVEILGGDRVSENSVIIASQFEEIKEGMRVEPE